MKKNSKSQKLQRSLSVDISQLDDSFTAEDRIHPCEKKVGDGFGRIDSKPAYPKGHFGLYIVFGNGMLAESEDKGFTLFTTWGPYHNPITVCGLEVAMDFAPRREKSQKQNRYSWFTDANLLLPFFKVGY